MVNPQFQPVQRKNNLHKRYTQQKNNMDPKNHAFEKDFPFNYCMLFFWGVSKLVFGGGGGFVVDVAPYLLEASKSVPPADYFNQGTKLSKI